MALRHGMDGWESHSASAKWWHCRCLWRESTGRVQYSSSRWWHVIHPGFSRQQPYSASQKWWFRRSLWKQLRWTMRGSAPGAGYVIHPGVGRWLSQRASSKRRCCDCFWWAWGRTMWHSIIGSRTLLHAGVGRRVFYRASPKWWQSHCVWRSWLWSVRLSSFGGGNVIHPGFCRPCSYRSSAKWWYGCCLRSKWFWENAKFRLWIRGSSTPRSRQVVCTQSFFGMMVKRWPAGASHLVSATCAVIGAESSHPFEQCLPVAEAIYSAHLWLGKRQDLIVIVSFVRNNKDNTGHNTIELWPFETFIFTLTWKLILHKVTNNEGEANFSFQVFSPMLAASH